jgi:hypothetical protein
MHQNIVAGLSLGRAPRLAAAGALVAAVAGALPAAAQQLPTPFSLASQLDLECHSAEGPPPAASVFIRQLNPVLQDHLPNQQVQLGPLEDVCVPVAKNKQVPTPDALNVARWVDLACYEASAPPVDVDVNLSHLNPVLAGLPDEDVKLVQVEQLCVPVRKNNAEIPQAVLGLVRHFDFACYRLEEPTEDVNFPLTLTHENPVIRALDLDDREVRMRRARQLCVPVGKNAQPIPQQALARARWLDFLRYTLTPATAAAIPAYQQPIPLWLTHLNPLFAEVPGFNTVLHAPLKLLVPVAKDGVLPPGGD